MPLAVTQEGDASGSRASAVRRGRSSAAAAMPTRTTRSMAQVRTRRKPSGSVSGSAQEPSARSKRRKRKRRAASNQRSNKQKRTREEGEEREEEVSSAGSSPLRVPHIPDEMYLLEDLKMGEAIMKAHDDYSAKLARQKLLPTLCRLPSCVVKDPKILHDRESTSKIVLTAAPSVIGLSSSVGGHLLTRCSGFWIDWDEEKQLGTVLTTAHLICTKSPSFDVWLGKDEYAHDAEVLVHLRGDTTEKKGHPAHLLYYQKHYNIALFEVKVDQRVQVLLYNENVKCAEEVFELGRDESSFLTISHGTVQYHNPNLFERYHYLYVHGASENLKYDNGGPVIDFEGKVVGMVNKSTSGSFVPSSILLKCLDLFKKFGGIPRPQLGLKFSAIKFLDPRLIEHILCKCNIADGLIVKEVSEGSPAEKLGFRLGDVIECLNGERVSTTVELENMLLSKCKDGISGLNSKVDLEIGVFHIRRKLWRSKTLSVIVSENPEVIVRGGYWPFGKGTSSVPVEQAST
uniref:Uncharacterized protein n=1 Tax=Avena sativa TaxID=4498 RepID=A0ACD5W5Z8_AVESA